MAYLDEKLSTFLGDLSARAPTPGGGSASALGGGIGMALAHMAAVFTSGNEKFKAAEPEVLALQAQFNALRTRFLELMEADIRVYGVYAAARGLPKNTPEEKQKRSTALREANAEATRVPEEIVAAALEGLALAERLGAVVNPHLAGDAAVAAYFLEAAARGAAIQVFSNCASADTEGRNAARRAAAAERIKLCQAARERIDQAVLKLLKLA